MLLLDGSKQKHTSTMKLTQVTLDLRTPEVFSSYCTASCYACYTVLKHIPFGALALLVVLYTM